MMSECHNRPFRCVIDNKICSPPLPHIWDSEIMENCGPATGCLSYAVLEKQLTSDGKWNMTNCHIRYNIWTGITEFRNLEKNLINNGRKRLDRGQLVRETQMTKKNPIDIIHYGNGDAGKKVIKPYSINCNPFSRAMVSPLSTHPRHVRW